MNILAQALEIQNELTDLLRKFHQIPEPSHYEFETHRCIRETLDSYSVQYAAPKDNITIALIEGEKAGNDIIGIRCDTDALQMDELTGLSYASKNPGLMHGCGHDAHIAMGLGAAKLLMQNRSSFGGSVKIIFQPAEEGERGAQETIETRLVDDVTAFFAIHVWSLFESGSIHISPGPITASTDMFTIRITGKGGHGAYPHMCVDTVTAGAAIVTALQHIPSRFISPMEPVVMTIGSFHAGTRCNIIAQNAVLEGTFRSFNNEVRQEILSLMNRIVSLTAASHGCKADIEIVPATAATTNDDAVCARAVAAAERLVGKDNVGKQETSMVGDDFAEYLPYAPGCYVQLGIADKLKGTDYPHHHGMFKVDEDVLPLGVALMCEFVFNS